MDAFLKFSQSVKDTIYSVLGWIASALLLVLTLFGMLEIIRRYVFGVVFEWGQDGIIVGMIAAVALYIGVTQTRRSHLVMNAVVQLFHAQGYFRVVGIMRILVSAFVSIFCGSLSVTGWPTLSYAIDKDLSTYSLLIPLWPFFLMLMFGFGLMSFIAFLQTIEDIISYVRGEHLDSEMELTTDI
jgi:TRAP-type C4-dicarboxylate transport system permease small subunit